MAMTTWEYNSVDSLDIPYFDELGADGWELCGVIPNSSSEYRCFIFKRPRPAPKPVAPTEESKT